MINVFRVLVTTLPWWIKCFILEINFDLVISVN